MALTGFHAIVPAGGAGTRLWPLSRQRSPKFLHDLTGVGRTLLQQTWDRLEPLAGAEGIVVVTGQAHVDAVLAQLPSIGSDHLLAEPSPRDSAAAICLAAAVIERRHPGAVVGSFAADHVIRDVKAFHSAVDQAVVAAREGYVVTIGIQPDAPSTAFGYIQLGKSLHLTGAPSVHAVEAFVEKPDAETAAAYLADGNFRWNAGMFVTRADVLLSELERNKPELYDGIIRIAAAWDRHDREAVLTRIWPALEKVAIDYAVAEPAAQAGLVAVVPAALGWDDIGDWDSLGGLLPGDRPVRVLGDASEVVSVNSNGVAVPESGRLVAIVGLDDVVVVDTPDAVLVTTRAKAQDVKKLVDELRATGRLHLL